MDPDGISEPQKVESDTVVRLSGPDAASLIGKVIAGKYEIVSFLGEGGMSSVFQAKDLVINRPVALKILLSLRSVDERSILRFQKEAMAAGRLNHPNIVRLYDVGTHNDGTPYLVMDYVPGITLSESIKSHGQLPAMEAVKLFVQVCDALTHAHSNGVIHRDIKPSNLLITSNADGSDVIKILDFGIAKVCDDALSGQQATRTGEVFGSPLYMSPEQAAGNKVDHRSDIYSTACALFEALSGLPPHVGDTTLSTIMKHQNETAPSLREASLGREFPAQLEAIVAKCLHKNPNERYQSMTDFGAALTAVLNGANSRSVVNTSLSSSQTEKVRTNADSGKPKINAGVVTICLLAIAVGLLSWLLIGKSSHRETLPSMQSPTSSISSTSPPPSSTSPASSTPPTPPLASASSPTSATSPTSSASPTPTKSTVPNPDSATVFPEYGYSEPTSAEYDKEIENWYRSKPAEAEIRLPSYQISSKGLATIAKFKSLSKLNLPKCKFNDLTPEWGRLASLPLSNFSATQSNLSDKGLLTITKITSLRDLNIGDCVELTDESLKNLPRLKLLRKLEAPGDKFTDKGLALMAQADNLVMLNVQGNRYIQGTAMSAVAKMKRLDHLMIGGTAINDATLVPIGISSSIGVLNINNSKITNASIPTILKLKHHLRNLSISNTLMTDAAIEKFAELQLNELHAENCRSVSLQALDKFRQQHPHCEVYDEAHRMRRQKG